MEHTLAMQIVGGFLLILGLMKNKDPIKFNKGIFLTAAGSFWWGLIGVIYFKYISFAGHIEVVIHRSLWTTVMLILTSILFSKFDKIKKIIKKKNYIFVLFLTTISKSTVFNQLYGFLRRA